VQITTEPFSAVVGRALHEQLKCERGWGNPLDSLKHG